MKKNQDHNHHKNHCQNPLDEPTAKNYPTTTAATCSKPPLILMPPPKKSHNKAPLILADLNTTAKTKQKNKIK